jgi:hypothetical protein
MTLSLSALPALQRYYPPVNDASAIFSDLLPSSQTDSHLTPYILPCVPSNPPSDNLYHSAAPSDTFHILRLSCFYLHARHS